MSAADIIIAAWSCGDLGRQIEAWRPRARRIAIVIGPTAEDARRFEAEGRGKLDGLDVLSLASIRAVANDGDAQVLVVDLPDHLAAGCWPSVAAKIEAAREVLGRDAIVVEPGEMPREVA